MMRRLGVALLLGIGALPATAMADQSPGHERVDHTAYTLRRREALIGLGSVQYGILDQLTIGTYLPTWFLFPVLRAPVATGFLKVRDWLHGPLAVSLRGTFVYLDASSLSSELSKNRSTTAGLLVIPVELSASMRIVPRLSQSVQFTAVYLGIGGNVPSDTTLGTGLGFELGGSTASTTYSLSLLTELRLSRVVALTLRENLMLGSHPLVVEGHYEQDGTRVDAKLGATSQRQLMIGNVIGGVAFSWKNVNLQLGAGYGANWLPFLQLPTGLRTIVPDLDFYVRF